MYSDITGVILAGGKSSRMGVNKSFLKLGNQTIIERIVELMKSIFTEVIIITNTPDEYKFLKLPLYEDIYKWKGPLAGIHSALTHSQTEKIFVLSCDVPLMSKEMIEYIANYKTDKGIIITRAAGYLQPLVGTYGKSILPEAEEILKKNPIDEKLIHYSLHKLIETTKTKIIDPTSLPFYSDELFFNINNMEDFRKIQIKF